MNQELTKTEIDEIKELCFQNPVKACAVAQKIIDVCGMVSCNGYAKLSNKSTRHIQYISETLVGINIENRKYISLNQ
jgi:hypothetical protein